MDPSPPNEPFDLEDEREETEPFEALPILDAHFIQYKILLPMSEGSESLYEKSYFGTLIPPQQIELEWLEALLLLDRKRIRILTDRNEEMTFSDLLSAAARSDSRIWVKYMVYRDLRQRGYIVRTGYGDGLDFRVFPRGSSRLASVAKYFIFILDEETPIHLQNLDKITQLTLNARKDLLLAIVDRLGDPTYYQLEQFKLTENINKKKNW